MSLSIMTVVSSSDTTGMFGADSSAFPIFIIIGIPEEDAEPDTKKTWIAIDLHTSALGDVVPDHDHTHGLALLPDAIVVRGPALPALITPIVGTIVAEDGEGQEMDATPNQAMSRRLLDLLRRA